MHESLALRGLLNINKPTGTTSRAVVDVVARLARRTKVGHAGTLDPLASGVLVVALGSATRLVEHVQRMTKTYRAVVRLGARSDTDDIDGRIVEVKHPPIPTGADVRQAALSQLGAISQRPPEYSALRIKGRRAYDLARSGKEVHLEPRPVRIDQIKVLGYHWPRIELEIDCGGGTYIRSIARDLGDHLNCGGLIEELVRTRIGHFRIEEAVDPMSLTADSLAGSLRPSLAAVADLPAIVLDASQVAAIAQGRGLPAAGLGLETAPEGEVALVDQAGQLVAVARGDLSRNTIQPTKVLV